MYLENCVPEQCILKSYNSTECSAVQDVGLERAPISHYNDIGNTINSDTEDIDSSACTVAIFSKVKINELPPDLLSMMKGSHRPLPNDYNLPPPPPWLDIERMRKGQAFAHKYFYGLNYAQTISLLLLLVSADGLKPLIFTGKSHTPNLAKKRYLSTELRVKSWYDTEIWKASSEGNKNLRRVRAMHISVSERLNSLSFDEVRNRSNLEEKLKSSKAEISCPLIETLKKDFSLRINGPSYPIYEKKENRVYLNQMEMAITHLGFFGLMLLYPDKFAAKTATDEELADFVHLWRYIGYMLGLEDEYNVCTGDLAAVRRKAKHMVEYIVRPMLLNANKEWEHMSRSALLGIEQFTKLRISFESTVLYLYWVLGVETPYLKENVGFKETMVFNVIKYLMTVSYKIPGVLRFLNYLVKRNIEQAAKTEYNK